MADKNFNKLIEMDSFLINYNKSNPVTHSLIIYKDNKLIFEKYYNGFNENKLSNLKSVTKSITSLLIGIAIDKRLIKNENQKLIDIMPELYNGNIDERKKEITIRHLLTMSAGFEWNNFGGKWRTGWDNSKNQNKYLIEKVPFKNNPGEVWNYNSGLSHLLSGIIKKVSGVNTLEFARKNLFDPLDIKNIKWEKSSDGNEKGNSELWLRPKDLAKIGLMILNEGKWNNKKIISKSWIDKSTKKYFDGFPQIGGYGYHWHTRKFGKYNSYLAAGWGGQFLIVIPAKNLVVVNTSKWNVPKSTYIIFDVIEKYLINL
ncbi:serine hydrolase domain-containing protein [Rosettibacter firmus]|uniref:serine hydrolase domain-containing protein n=1 Tax=Rosettibacter firmus TaxID=3111522 RepID=UPI00336BB683